MQGPCAYETIHGVVTLFDVVFPKLLSEPMAKWFDGNKGRWLAHLFA